MTKRKEPAEHADHRPQQFGSETQPQSSIVGDGGPDDTQDDGSSNAAAGLALENADLKDRLLRALAEVENVRRRAERDVADARQYAIAKFAGDVLSVADNLGRALAAMPAEVQKARGPVRTFIEGVELTERELLQVFERHGIRKLDPVGERFDPNFHEALFTVPDPSLPAGAVSKVVEPGYAIGTRPLRPAKVGIVAAKG